MKTLSKIQKIYKAVGVLARIAEYKFAIFHTPDGRHVIRGNHVMRILNAHLWYKQHISIANNPASGGLQIS